MVLCREGPGGSPGKRSRGEGGSPADQRRTCFPGCSCSRVLVSPQLVYPSDFRLTDKEVGPGPLGSRQGSELSRPSPGFLCFRKTASATYLFPTPTQVGSPRWDVGSGLGVTGRSGR